MRIDSLGVSALLALVWVCSPMAAHASSPAGPATATAPKTPEALEDLRILALINALQPTREQLTQLAALAGAGREGMAAREAEVKRILDRQRPTLLAAREALLRGHQAAPTLDTQITSAGQLGEEARAQKTDALIASLAQRVRAILSPEQVRVIELELAPTGDQPWRLYSRGVSGPSVTPPGSTRLPSDPGTWRKELRDLRARAAVGNPQAELEAFSKKLTRGLRSGTPLFDQSAAQARAFATQALSLPPAAYHQQEWALSTAVAKLGRDALNQQRSAEGKQIEVFAADRWLVEQVLLSPRAASTFLDRAEAP